MQIQLRKSGVVLLAGVMLVLAGCEKSKDSGQSLVKVNGKEITIHQLNTELKSSPNLPMSTLLEALINRQLLVDAATKAKLDEDPGVLAELQKARDTVLAQAYVVSRVGPIDQPKDEQIEQFYKDNADNFAQRRQYEFSELIVDPKDMKPEIESYMNGKRNIEDMASYLSAHQVAFRRETVSRFSSELPPLMAKSLRTMEPGTLFVVKEANQTLLVSLRESKPVPLSISAAAPQIKQLLANQKYTELVNAQIKPLKEAGKIEYLTRGEAIMKAAPKAQAAGSADAKETQQDAGQVQRGIAGMK